MNKIMIFRKRHCTLKASEHSFETITLMIADEIITEGTRGGDSKITRENLIFRLLY